MSDSCIVKQMHCLLSAQSPVQSPCTVSMCCCHALLIVQLWAPFHFLKNCNGLIVGLSSFYYHNLPPSQ